MTTARLILILAAGASSRMRGTDKLLEEIDGQPQIRRITKEPLRPGRRSLSPCRQTGLRASQP